MRRPLTTATACHYGISPFAISRAVKAGRMQRLQHGVYVMGSNPPTAAECALGVAIGTGGVVSGTMAGILHELDGVTLRKPFVTVDRDTRRTGARRLRLPAASVMELRGYRCTTGLQTVIDLSAQLADTEWEQALESALRKKLFTVDELQASLTSVAGVKRMRRALKRRPHGAPPTESLLETLAVQLIREAGMPDPDRQVEVWNGDTFIARVDLAWPSVGLFVELDGQHHKDQPVYDAFRETSVVLTTGWLVGRFTWYEIVVARRSTGKRLAQLHAQAAARWVTMPRTIFAA